MSLFQYQSNSPLESLCTAHPECLLAFLNSYFQFKSPLVKGAMNLENPEKLLRRDDVEKVLYLLDCENQAGETVEVSLAIGMNGAEVGGWMQNFSKMALQNALLTEKNNNPDILATLVCLNCDHDQKIPLYFYTGFMSSGKENLSQDNPMSEQKFAVLSLEKYQNRSETGEKIPETPTEQDLWTEFFLDHNSAVLKDCATLPEHMQTAIDFLNK